MIFIGHVDSRLKPCPSTIQSETFDTMLLLTWYAITSIHTAINTRFFLPVLLMLRVYNVPKTWGSFSTNPIENHMCERLVEMKTARRKIYLNSATSMI